MQTGARQDIINRGAAARQLLESETLNAAFDDQLQNLWESFISSQQTDEQILELHRQAIAIKACRGNLHRYVEDEKIEIANKKIDEG